MLQQKEAVIFDMDGSLVDSMWVWKDIDIEYLGRFGLDIPDDLQQEIEGTKKKLLNLFEMGRSF